MMDRRTFLKSAAASAITPVWGQQRSRKPNFIVILADDMGYSDSACYGGDIETPNLDGLAAGGLRFTQAYSTARCGPSRNCLLTGYYAQQTAADIMTPGNVPEWTSFLPEYLKPHGYRSYHSGKWHIKFKAMSGAGFDRSFMLLDENRYFSPRLLHLNEQPLPPIKPDEDFYLPNAIGEHSVGFLQQHEAEHPSDPFFLYLAFTSPHFPLHAPQKDIDRYKDRFSEGWDAAREKRFQRMRRMGIVNCELSPLEPGERPRWNTPDSELFAKIGAVVEQLRSANQLDNTVILFLSDNGASAEQIIRGDGHVRQRRPVPANRISALDRVGQAPPSTCSRRWSAWPAAMLRPCLRRVRRHYPGKISRLHSQRRGP